MPHLRADFLETVLRECPDVLQSLRGPAAHVGQRRISPDDLMHDYHRVVRFLGRHPTWAEIDRHAKISRGSYQTRIGKIADVRDAYAEWLERHERDEQPALTLDGAAPRTADAFETCTGLTSDRSAPSNPVTPQAGESSPRRAPALIVAEPVADTMPSADSRAPASSPPRLDPSSPPTPASMSSGESAPSAPAEHSEPRLDPRLSHTARKRRRHRCRK